MHIARTRVLRSSASPADAWSMWICGWRMGSPQRQQRRCTSRTWPPIDMDATTPCPRQNTVSREQGLKNLVPPLSVPCVPKIRTLRVPHVNQATRKPLPSDLHHCPSRNPRPSNLPARPSKQMLPCNISIIDGPDSKPHPCQRHSHYPPPPASLKPLRLCRTPSSSPKPSLSLFEPL